MVKEAIVLLMFFGSPLQIQEYTVRDGLSECLKTKRTISRNVKSSGSNAYKGSMRLACKKLMVKVDEDNRILEFVTVKKSELEPF